MAMNSLGDVAQIHLPRDKYIIVRLKGKKFDPLIDDRDMSYYKFGDFQSVIDSAAERVLIDSRGILAHVHDEDISFLIPPGVSYLRRNPFAISTVVSSFMSAYISRNLPEGIGSSPYFVGHAWSCQSLELAISYFYSEYRRSIGETANRVIRRKCGAESLIGMSINDKIDVLHDIEEELGLVHTEESCHGMFISRKVILVETDSGGGKDTSISHFANPSNMELFVRYSDRVIRELNLNKSARLLSNMS